DKLVRLESELISLLGFLADRQQPNRRIAYVEDLFRETHALVGELQEIVGPGVGVGARVEQNRRSAARGNRHGDRGAAYARDSAQLEQASSQHRPGVARRDDGVSLAFGDGPAGDDEGAVWLGADGFGRYFVHRDHVGRLEQGEPVRVEA